MSEPLPKLELRGVSKSYPSGRDGLGQRVTALRDVNLTIADGEFVTLVGASGCGKTTLLNVFAGFEKPDTGETLFDGKPIAGAGPERLALFQDPGLFPWLNVRRNVEFGLKLRGVPRDERQQRARDYLAMVHLKRFEHSFPFQLSGGMRQRVAIARALAVDPGVLLMDEPFGALDPRTRDLLHDELQSLWMRTRKTIVFVTHSFEEAVRLSDRVVVLGADPGHVRKIVPVPLPRPRDFLDPRIGELRAQLLRELEPDVDRQMREEGDDDWRIAERAVRAGPPGGVAPAVADRGEPLG